MGQRLRPRPCLLVGLTHGGREPGPPAHSAQVLQLWESVPGQVRLPGSGGGLPGSRWAGSRRQGSSSHSEHNSQQSPRCLGDETCLEKWGLSALAPSLRLAVAGVSSPYWSPSQAGPGRFPYPRELVPWCVVLEGCPRLTVTAAPLRSGSSASQWSTPGLPPVAPRENGGGGVA